MSAAADGRAPVDKEIVETTGSAPKQAIYDDQDVEVGPEEMVNIDRIEKVYRHVAHCYRDMLPF